MSNVQTGISIGTLLFLLAVTMGVLLRRARVSRAGLAGDRTANRDGSFQHRCEICGDETLITSEALHTLSSAEKALAVRENVDALGKVLKEYVCRNCDASHCFALSGDTLTHLGVNLYEGQQFGARCAECQCQLIRPPWDRGEYDGHLAEAPGLLDRIGLACPYCGGVSCVNCCSSFTRKRTSDGSLLCPRCSRGPQETFFHP